jgi:hypothetical protein
MSNNPFLDGNFMDYLGTSALSMPGVPRGKKRKARPANDFGYDLGFADIGLDLSKVANMGISGGSDFGISSPVKNKMGFEEYIARDFANPKVYGSIKTPKSERRFRSIDYATSPELYGMESLGIGYGKSERNLNKSGKYINKQFQIKRKQISTQIRQEGTLLDKGRKYIQEKQARKKYYKDQENYDSEPRQKAESPVQSEPETYDDYNEVRTERVKKEYFPDYDERPMRGSPTEPYEGEMRTQVNKGKRGSGVKRIFKW